MGLNTDINFDVNKGLENSESKRFTINIVVAAFTLLVIFLAVVFLLGGNGTHVKTPIVEIGDKPKDPTTSIIVDKSVKINVKGDYVNGNKIVYERKTDSLKSKSNSK